MWRGQAGGGWGCKGGQQAAAGSVSPGLSRAHSRSTSQQVDSTGEVVYHTSHVVVKGAGQASGSCERDGGTWPPLLVYLVGHAAGAECVSTCWLQRLA